MISAGSLISIWEQPRSRGVFFVSCIALLGASLIGSSLAAWQSSIEQERMFAAHAHTLRVLRSAYAIKVATLNTLQGERGYLVTGDPQYLKPYFDGRRALSKSVDDLDRITQGHSVSEASVAELRSLADAFLHRIHKIVRLARSGDLEGARKMIGEKGAQDGIAQIDQRIDAAIVAERARMHATYDRVEQSTAGLRRLAYVTSFAGLSVLVMALVFASALRRSLARERTRREELQRQAETDPLTGVANRRRFLEYLDRRIAQARLTGTPLAFALVDIDNFKPVNDIHGHAVGDEAIRHIVHAAQKTVRGNDMIGRLGGEEFGIILPKSSKENAVAVCDRLRERLRDAGYKVDEQTVLRLTVSSGIAALTDEDDAASLMARADKALYEAKRNGRDQVRLAA